MGHVNPVKPNHTMPHPYPIFLDLTGRRVTIVGGGAVAARKAAGLLEAGAKSVKVVSITFTGTFDKRIETVEKRYEPTDINGTDMVFAATDSSAVNDAVVNDARARRIWVSRADTSDQSPGDFFIPAKFTDGPITLAVSAGSPALSKCIVEQLALGINPGWIAMADAMTTLRPMLRDQSNLSPTDRKAIFHDLASKEAIAVLRDQKVDGLIAWLRERHRSLGP